MKEFVARTGGRHVYLDDFANLQELALAITSIFGDCNNFIISGCNVSGSNISEGYVFINGKIRKSKKITGVSQWPCYIYEKNNIENVAYKDSGDKEGWIVYGCDSSTSIPSSPDPVTSTAPEYITINSTGDAPRLEDQFVGKYAMVLHHKNAQTVEHDVKFSTQVEAKDVQINNQLSLTKGGQLCTIAYDEANNLVITSSKSEQEKYLLKVNQTDGFAFYHNDTLICSINENGLVMNSIITVPKLKTEVLSIQNNHIFDHNTASDNGVLNLNMLGYNSASSYFRDFVVGDGKGTEILHMNGQKKMSDLNSSLKMTTSIATPLVFKHATLSKTSAALQSGIQWLDKDDVEIGNLGFIDISNFDFYINNVLGNIRINSNTYIDGELFVGDVNLTKDLVHKDYLTQQLNTVVKKSDSIGVFVEQAGGGAIGQKSVCNTIGAAEATVMNQSLKGIMQTVTEFTSDTQWVDIKGNGVSAKARQIGHMVCICGYAYGPGTEGGKCPFSLPELISKPDFPITQVCGTQTEFVTIAGRQQIGDWPNETYATAGTYFSVTYLF